MPGKPNPIDKHAVILFVDKNLDRIIPDEFEAKEGTVVEWVIRSPNATRIDFKDDSPLEWSYQMSDGDHEKITGTVQKDTKRRKPYKYFVSDGQGNTIDPRLRIKG
jgi:hypothetical protein